MKMNDRMNTLNNNGIDTTKYFTLTVNESIPAGSKIDIAVTEPNPTAVEKTIKMDGYVKNSKIHRRWITAQYMRMLNSDEGWTKYFKHHYGYMYQFEMMLDEVKVLSKLQHKDWETYKERSQFFTLNTIREILHAYAKDCTSYVYTLAEKATRKCRGQLYITVGYRNILVSEIESKVLNPIRVMVGLADSAYSYDKMYGILVGMKSIMVTLPWETKKIPSFVNAFQLEGAYYTLRNLIMFHDVKLWYEDCAYDMEMGLAILKGLPKKYMGYQMNALLKKTIAMNHFDFKKSIVEHM